MKFGLTPRAALTTRNMEYFQWRYLFNAKRTFRALLAPHHPIMPFKLRPLEPQGIHVTPSDCFLSGSGRRALDEVCEHVLELSRRD